MASTINVALRSNFMTAVVSRSNFLIEIANVLYLNGFIRGFTLRANTILFFLKHKNSKAVISSLKVISTPGRRVYWGLSSLSKCYNAKAFAGLYIISTPSGLLTSNECLLFNRNGGEVILKIEI